MHLYLTIITTQETTLIKQTIHKHVQKYVNQRTKMSKENTKMYKQQTN